MHGLVQLRVDTKVGQGQKWQISAQSGWTHTYLFHGDTQRSQIMRLRRGQSKGVSGYKLNLRNYESMIAQWQRFDFHRLAITRLKVADSMLGGSSILVTPR